jgi:hypothetical protein
MAEETRSETEARGPDSMRLLLTIKGRHAIIANGRRVVHDGQPVRCGGFPVEFGAAWGLFPVPIAGQLPVGVHIPETISLSLVRKALDVNLGA